MYRDMLMQDFIQDGTNVELENCQNVQIYPENKNLALYTLTPEDTSYDTNAALEHISQHTEWEPFYEPDSGGYEIGVLIPYTSFKEEWFNMTVSQFEEVDEITTISTIIDNLSDEYVL